jgi:transcriptional regulator with XRE-family HTH domain
MATSAIVFGTGQLMHEQEAPVRHRHFLREWREARGLSLADMAALTPFGKSTLSRVETGRMGYYADIIEEYARVIGCKPYALLQRPPGGPDDLFILIDKLLEADRVADLHRVEEITKILLE